MMFWTRHLIRRSRVRSAVVVAVTAALTALVALVFSGAPARASGGTGSAPNYEQQQELAASDNGLGSPPDYAPDRFGSAVAVSADGSTAVVGAPDAAYGGLVYVFTRSSGGWSQAAELYGNNSPDNRLGASVALSADGTTLLVGDPGTDQYIAGQAAVYTSSGGTWSQTAGIGDTGQSLPPSFGRSVALSGDGSTAVVGSAGGASVYTAAGGWSTGTQLTPSDGGAGFGQAVAVDSAGGRVLVGAPGNDSGYVFDNGSGGWSQTAELTAAGAGGLGDAVALSGDGVTALLGADTTSSNTGAAYVFTAGSGGWAQGATLTAPGGQAGDGFGTAVALSADAGTALVGADNRASSTGAAYLYGNSGGSWSAGSEISALDGAAGDQFGSSVALSADASVLMVGAPGRHSSAGVVYAFVPAPSNQLVAADGAQGDQFGFAVAVSADGSTALVGAPTGNTAYLFTDSGGGWTQTAELSDPGSAGNGFGFAVALSADGSTALVGAPTGDTAYLFTHSGGSWTPTAALTGADLPTADQFGNAVALSRDGSVALVGAPSDDSTGAGAADVYTRSGGTWSQTAQLSCSCTDTGFFGRSVALSADGTTALVGNAASKDPYLSSASVFSNTAGAWTQTALLSDQIYGSTVGTFGWSVALSADGRTALIAERGEEALVFTADGGSWTSSATLSPADQDNLSLSTNSVSLSADGSRALLGAYPHKDQTVGAGYVFTDSGGSWSQTQQLTAPDEEAGCDLNNAYYNTYSYCGDAFGWAVGLSGDGATALVGAPGHNAFTGAAYTYSMPAVAHQLSVQRAGTGSGTVTSSPSGIDCGSTCAAWFGAGSTVTLTATPATGSAFTGWSGAGCSGTGTCTVTMSSDTAVTATFQPVAPDLAVSNAAPASVVSGQRLTYTITVTNTGNAPATQVKATDLLPTSVQYKSASTSAGRCAKSATGGVNNKGGTVTCSIGTLAGGGSATIRIVVGTTTPGTISGTATATASNVTRDDDDSATVATTVQGT